MALQVFFIFLYIFVIPMVNEPDWCLQYYNNEHNKDGEKNPNYKEDRDQFKVNCQLPGELLNTPISGDFFINYYGTSFVDLFT